MHREFIKTAKSNPNNVAIDIKNKEITYRQLTEYVNRLADAFISFGINSSTPVGVVLSNTTLNVISILALSSIKAKIMLFQPKMTAKECQDISQFSPQYIIFDNNKFFVKDGTISLKGFSDVHLSCFSNYEIKENINELQGDIIFFSSGSTGKPKGIMKTNEQIFIEAEQVISTLGIQESDTFLCAAQLCHAYGFMFGMIIPLIKGCKITYVDPIVLVSNLETLLKNNTIFVGLPIHYQLLYKHKKQNFSNIKISLVAGSSMTKEEKKMIEALNLPMNNIYGMSETGALLVENIKEYAKDLYTYPYRPIEGVKIKLDYAKSYNFEDQLAYELLVKTNSLCSYVIDGNNIKKFSNDKWFPTGDLVVKNEKGFHIVGRKDLTINVSGKKVNPFEIESVLKEHPSINEVVVLGIPDNKRGEIPIAFITINSEISIDDLFSLCREKLSSYKVPRHIEIKKVLPTSIMGKVLRKF